MQFPPQGELFEGRFVVGAQLRETEFATVFAGQDHGSDRAVVLKFLTPDTASGYTPQTRQRFQREVRVIAALRDPHTVRLFNYGESGDGLLYLVFEHVPGQGLDELLRQRTRLGAAEVAHVLRQILSSLREAHQAGLIHRDIRPPNIRAYEYGGDPLAAKLLDFGIARSTDEGHPSITKTGEILGTPRYMSPEQLFGEPLTASSDICSLGLVAFELLAGRDALRGFTVSEQVERLRAGHVLRLPVMQGPAAGLMQVLERMTARDPAARYQSAASVLAALDEFNRSNAPPRQVPPDFVDNPPARTVQSTTPWIPVAAVAAIAIGAVVLAVVRREGESPSPSPAPQTTRPPSALVRGAFVNDSPPVVVDSQPDVGPNLAPAEIRAGASPSEGCHQPVASGLQKVGGTLAYVPRGYDARVPHPTLVLVHGDYQSAADFVRLSGFLEIADREGIVLLAPEDLGPTPIRGARTWRSATGVATVRGSYQRASHDLCLDQSRTYVLGHAAGARVVASASCESWVSAVVFSGFALGEGDAFMKELCDNPKPALWLYPTSSPHIANGAKNCMGETQYTVARTKGVWRKRNRCKGRGTPNPVDGSGSCARFQCEAAFELCELDGGTLWPDGTQEFPGHALLGCDGDAPVDFPVAEHAWAFFQWAKSH